MTSQMKLLPLAFLALGSSVLAQQIPGGGIQLKPLTPPSVPATTAPVIRIEQATAPVATDTAAIRVRVDKLEFSGVSASNASKLTSVAGFTPRAELSLGDLQAMARRITEFYRQQGYFVARAYLPAQDISDHIVTIAVSEGRYGEVTVRNQGALAEGVAEGFLAGLDSGDVITLEPLEHRLLLLSDIPGVKVTSTLVPGTLPGSSNLIVDVARGRRVTGLVDVDNAGNPYTGENRLGATVNFNNLLGRGDVASLRVVSSGQGLNYGRASYQMLVGPATVGLAYSRLEYELGKQFEVLGANGTAEIASLFGAIPLVRTRRTNLYAGVLYEDKAFDDRIDLIASASRRADAGVGSLFLRGDHQDAFGGGGASSFYISLSAGNLDILTPSARLADASSARTQGDYRKLWLYAARQQRVTNSFSLHASITGQLASKNLDPSEKMVLGGMDGVRAYPQGEAFGDEGLLLNVEARQRLTSLSGRTPGEFYLLGFIDHGRITIDKQPWFPGVNERNLSGAGIGGLWTDPGNYLVRAYYARKLGNEVALSAPDESGRFWVQAIKYF